MSWTKGKIEKAWRVFDKSMGVIADALEVDVLELKALILEGTLPIYDRTPAVEIRNMEAAGMDVAAVMAERQVDQDLAPKRATLADLAPPATAAVLEQAAPIIEKPIAFRKPVHKSQIHTSNDEEKTFDGPGIDRQIERQGERKIKPPPRENFAPHPKPKAAAGFYLMHDGKYLHQSCTGLTDKREFAWCQPENKIAAVRKRYPETLDYLEVRA